MKINLFKAATFTSLLLSSMTLSAQTTRKMVENKISQLEKIVEKLEEKGIDTKREEAAIHTTLLFLDYADWDDANVEKNIECAKTSQVYKVKAEESAKDLPNFERDECLKLVEDAIETAQKVLDGKYKRNESVEINWKELDIKGAQIVDKKGNPRYVNDYNFMPHGERHTKYYGDYQGVQIDFHLTDSTFTFINEKRTYFEKAGKDSHFGGPFVSHNVAKWMLRKDSTFSNGNHTFIKYDIDNPNTPIYWNELFSRSSPYLAGTAETRMGYALANEPHWHTANNLWDTPVDKITDKKNNWATGPVSHYTIEKFRTYLKDVHSNIETLNSIWGSNYSSFDQITIKVPVDNHLLGSAKWYDWMKFNQYRVNRFFDMLLATIRKYDPKAYAHVKVMPNLWTENKRDHGLDFEYLCSISRVIGNDASANKKLAWGKPQEWEENYIFAWHELCMGYDMFKSFGPDKVNVNTEAHYTMCNGFQDYKCSVDYARTSYLLSTIFGCSFHNSWCWSRGGDNIDNFFLIGSTRGSHFGSFATQPRVVNELTQLMMDFNENGDDFAALQNVNKPIRIFYSETSAINRRNYQSGNEKLYEKLFFDGTQIGFATQNIIKEQNNKNWDVVLVKENQYVTTDEIKALQSYLDKGGVVVIDDVSLKMNQYKQPHPASLALKESKGKIIRCNDVEEFIVAAHKNVNAKSLTPISFKQTLNKNDKKVCYTKVAKCGKNRYVAVVTNLGREPQTVTINIDNSLRYKECKDLFTGEDKALTFTIEPEVSLVYEIGKL